MANVTIPNLPQVTATTDLDILVITDSGETTTSKITKSDFLSGSVGNLVQGGGTDTYTTTGNEGQVSGTNNILLTANRSSSISLGGTRNTVIINSGGVNGGTFTGEDILWAGGSFFENSSRSIGGKRNTILSSVYVKSNPSSQNTFTAASSRPEYQNTADYASIISVFNGLINNADSSVLLGGNGTEIQNLSNHSVIAGGKNNLIQGQFVDQTCGDFIGGGQNIDNYGYNSGIVGGRGIELRGRYNFIGAGRNQLIEANSDHSAIIAGNNNTITSDSDQSVIIGGSGNTLTGDNTVIIGGYGLTYSGDNTTAMSNGYVDSHFTYNTYSGVSIGNEQLFDADNGMVQYFDNPAGNLNIRTVNVKNGEVYDMILGGAGGVSINSVGANDAGFTAVDNTSAASGSYLHLRIAVVNDLVVFSTL